MCLCAFVVFAGAAVVGCEAEPLDKADKGRAENDSLSYGMDMDGDAGNGGIIVDSIWESVESDIDLGEGEPDSRNN